MKKILVIEDESFIRIGIQELLTSSGYDVFTAEEGIQGIKLGREINPDLVICDIMMPGEDGYSVLKNFSEDKKTCSIPFIFLTAKAEMIDLRKGMELGADDYIVKPFESATLLKAIETRIKKKETLKKAAVINFEDEISKESKRLTENASIFIDSGKKSDFLKINNISAICALGNYSNLFTNNNKKIMVRKTLSQWMDILPESCFIKIHRSTIINLNYIEKISKWSSGTYRVYMKFVEEPFSISQRRAHEIKSNLKI